METYSKLSKAELDAALCTAKAEYEDWANKGLSLDMSRGKPGPDQLDLSPEIFTLVNSENFHSETGMDCRNYGCMDGLPELKELFSHIFEVSAEQVIVGGNSSLNMMFDTVSEAMIHGFSGEEAWLKQKDIKFICLVPGYDRHFSICEYFGIKMIPVLLTENGPDMKKIEELVRDESVKGMWCVPKYSNPTGCVYSDETVKKIAALKPAAKDFRIMWDNAYAIHHLGHDGDKLLSIYDECEKNGTEDMVIMFTSTSKITFPGAGIAAMAASPANIKEIKRRMSAQTIGPDKLNHLRHAKMFPDFETLRAHMSRHARILKPKFEAVLKTFNRELEGLGIAEWTKPQGGYFICLTVPDGCAKRTIELCAEAGLKLTSAGATWPYGNDPHDNIIRVAPSYPSVEELVKASSLLCAAVKLCALEKLSINYKN